MASAAVGLRPKRSKLNAFYGNAPHRGAGAQRLRGVPIGGSRKYGEKIFTPNGVNLPYFRLEPTPLGSERGEQPLSCNDDDRCLRQKQGGVVGAVASRMQGPLKGRSIRWEPQPVQGRGVSRGREGGVETPLSPSGPAERPRRRCRLQKPSGLPHAIALCMRNITKKAPAMRMHSGCLEGLCGDAQWVVPMSTARSASFFTTASTAFSRPRAIWCRSMLGVPRGLLTTCSMA